LERVEEEIPMIQEYSSEVNRLFDENGDALKYIEDLEISEETENALMKMLLGLYNDK
jgi:hypothetical protein